MAHGRRPVSLTCGGGFSDSVSGAKDALAVNARVELSVGGLGEDHRAAHGLRASREQNNQSPLHHMSAAQCLGSPLLATERREGAACGAAGHRQTPDSRVQRLPARKIEATQGPCARPPATPTSACRGQKGVSQTSDGSLKSTPPKMSRSELKFCQRPPPLLFSWGQQRGSVSVSVSVSSLVISLACLVPSIALGADEGQPAPGRRVAPAEGESQPLFQMRHQQWGRAARTCGGTAAEREKRRRPRGLPVAIKEFVTSRERLLVREAMVTRETQTTCVYLSLSSIFRSTKSIARTP